MTKDQEIDVLGTLAVSRNAVSRNVEDLSTMTLTGMLRTSVLISLLGVTVLAYSQDQRDDAKPEDKSAQQDEKPPKADDMKKQDEAKPPKQDDMKPAKQQDEMKPPKNDKNEEKEEKKEEKNEGKSENQNQANPSRPEQSQSVQQGAANPRGGGGHIPDNKFKANFGRQHTFVINRPIVVQGQPQFQYGGYTFTMVDAWPVGWAYTDDCYIDYIDGEYFLFDLLHPGVRVAVVVVM
jgi:hypothetical protein